MPASAEFATRDACVVEFLMWIRDVNLNVLLQHKDSGTAFILV